MHFIGTGRVALTACAAAAGLLLAVAAASAGSLYQDRVHADSFGNLVIYSPSGYKRIIVGKGYAADGYNQTGSYYEPEAYEPDVVYLDEYAGRRKVRCNRPPVLLKGRDYMYGLPDRVLPAPAGLCP